MSGLVLSCELTVFWCIDSNQVCHPHLLPQSIEEVGGYVLIALNKVRTIPLDNLRIIRGHTLLEKKFALSVLSNFDKSTGKGTTELLLNSLTGGFTLEATVKHAFLPSLGGELLDNVFDFAEILNGGVQFSRQKLCNLETIQWYDIVNMENKPAMELPMATNNPRCKDGTRLTAVCTFEKFLNYYMKHLK